MTFPYLPAWCIPSMEILRKDRLNVRGWKRFIKRKILETSDYLKDDCLQVHCTVGVVESSLEPLVKHSISLPPSKMLEQLVLLLEDGIGVDVKFEVDGKVFSAHKVVLAAQSAVFRAQLFGPMKDDNFPFIKVEEMKAPVFKALLHFLYRDALPTVEESTGLNSKSGSALMSQHLLVAADRYGLDRLRLLCEMNISANIDTNTVATTLALAEQHLCHELKARCLAFAAIPKDLEAVMKTDGYKHLKESCPNVLLELLEYVGRYSKRKNATGGLGKNAVPIGSDANERQLRRRVSSSLGSNVIVLCD